MINEKRLLDEFLEFVQIDSESRNERRMGERLVEVLRGMGLFVATDKAGETFGSNGFNVFARLPGEGEPIALSAHMDTVVPGVGVHPVIRDGMVYSDGTTVLGGDDKSGICGILEALRVITEQKIPHRPAEIIFSIGEEIGMMGAKAFDSGCLSARKVYVFDSSGDVGKVIVEAPGQVKIFADVIGKRAHAGLAPEEGISAIQVMASAISCMHLLRIDSETTCNIGTIHAEYATNIVPEKCSMIAEVRSRDITKLNNQAEHIRACLEESCKKYGARLDCKIVTNYVSYRIAPDSDTVKPLLEAFARLGCKADITQGGGGSDANIYNARGFEAVVLGTGMSKVHTTEEYIKIENLNNTARLALDLLTH